MNTEEIRHLNLAATHLQSIYHYIDVARADPAKAQENLTWIRQATQAAERELANARQVRA